MFTELGVYGLLGASYYYYQNRDKSEVKKKWNSVMEGTNSRYQLSGLKRKDFGYVAEIYLHDGLSLKKLEELKPTIEDNMKCLIDLKKDNFSNAVYIKLITTPQNKIKFTPIKTEPYEIFLGYDFTGKAIKLNMNKFSHLLIAGVVGSGKSRLGFIIASNLINNHTEKEIQLYMTQVRKKDLKIFKNCNQVKWFAETMEETKLMFQKLCYVIRQRELLIEKKGVENIYEYNKVNQIKMRYIYLFAEEFAFYMPDASDTEVEKKLKEEVLALLKDIILTGRATGINNISTLQRSTVDCIPSTIKSMMSRVSFRQMSKINSQNIIECDDAVGLELQEAILFTNEYTRFKTPYINRAIMYEYIKDSLPEEFKKKEEQSQEEKPTKHGWHKPSKEEWKQIRDSLPLINVPELPKSVGKLPKPIRDRKGRNGIVPKKGDNNNANTEG